MAAQAINADRRYRPSTSAVDGDSNDTISADG
jgi:hypothetical protein